MKSHEIELAPGVVQQRRRLLFWLPAAAVVGLAAGSEKPLTLKQSSNSERGGLAWDDFLEECPPASEQIFDGRNTDQDAYLFRIASYAARLKLETVRRSKLNKWGPIELNVSFRGVPFFVVEWRMAPNAVLPAHCHPNVAVCTLGLEGEARLRNFAVEGKAPSPNSGSKETFLIRMTKDQVLVPGGVNTLSMTRDNIHYFEASKHGARGIDITTDFGGDGSFSFLRFDLAKPVDETQRIFKAGWTGKDPLSAMS